MDRRAFLKTAAVALAALAQRGIASTSPISASPSRGEATLKNWVWITMQAERSADEWKRSFALMRQSGVQAILPELYNGADACYGSRILPVKTDQLATLLPLARAEGLEVHAWMAALLCSVPEVMKRHPEWYNVNARGESSLDKPAYVSYYHFLDPGPPEVRDWLHGIVKELASIPELSGIHLDYIRYPDAILPSGLWKKYNIVQDQVYPQYDYGYTEYERRQFKKKYGVDPLDIKDPAHQQQWLQFRYDTVTELVNQHLVPAARAQGKTITAAVFPGPSLAREMVRQDWARWNLDAFFPMLYYVFYEAGPEWMKRLTREGVAAVNKPLYSGLYVHKVEAPEFVQALNMAVQGGASGVSLFSLDGMNGGKWAALRDFSTQAVSARPLRSRQQQ